MRWQRRNIAPALQGRGWGGAVDDTEFVRQLYARANEMRRNPTPFEVIVWRNLSRSQIGHKFRRQHVIAPFIVDFFCPAKSLAIEIDGVTHSHDKDRTRDARLAQAGVRTLHFANEEIADNMDGVLLAISAALDQAPLRWAQPHPNPSPEGEGL